MLAYTYYASLTVIESGSSSYDMLPLIAPADNQWMADNGFFNSTANNTRVQTVGGLIKPHLVTDNMTLTAIPVPASSQTNLQFTTGNSELSAMDIIMGYGGKVTKTDDPDMELFDNFSVEWSGWLNTDNGTSKNLVYKQDAFRLYVSETVAENVTAIVESDFPVVAAKTGGTNTANTSHTVNLPSGVVSGNLLVAVFSTGGSTAITFPAGWTQLFQTSEPNHVTCGAWYRVADGGEGASITVTTAASKRIAYETYRITDYSGVPEAGASVTDYSKYPDPPNLATSWSETHNLWLAVTGYGWNYTISAYPSNYSNGVNRIGGDANYEGGNIGVAERKVVAISENPGTFTIDEDTMYWIANTIAISPAGDLEVTATGVDSSKPTVNVWADTVNLYISVDSAVSPDPMYDEVALSGASVADNNNSWVIMDNSTTQFTAYTDYFKLYVAGDLIVWYEPTSMIIGTVLPDRCATGGSEDGVITWGENPAGVTVSLGSLASTGQPSIGAPAERGTPDVLPEIGVSDWHGSPAASRTTVTGSLATNPIRSFVTILTASGSLNEVLAWRFLGGIFVMFVLGLAAKFAGDHYLIVGIATGCAFGVLVASDSSHVVFPMWLLVLIVVCVVGGLVAERTPSL